MFSSLWHILMAAALLCLLPQCRPRMRKKLTKTSCSHPKKEVLDLRGGNLNPQMEEGNREEDDEEDIDESPTVSFNSLFLRLLTY